MQSVLHRKVSRFTPRHSTPNPPTQWLASSHLAAFRAAGTTAHRIYSSPGAWLERFGDDLLLSYKTEPARDLTLAGLPEWEAVQGLPHRRIFGKFIPLQNEHRVAPTLLEGSADEPLETVVGENGVRYGLDFAAGYSAGLFIDQRANRYFVQQNPGKRLLNTFAYTCSFSVVAARAGATTVSIDLSKKSLDRGRENFALNELDATAHAFLADDVLDVLPRLARRGETYDTIILDPPTFSRGNQGRKFQVERDFEELLVAALAVATSKARLLLSTNCTRLPVRTLEMIARFCLKATRKAGDFHREPPLPDIPASLAAQTLWLVLK